MSIKDEVNAFKRDLLSQRLMNITEPQRGKFDRIFPNGVLDSKMEDAIDLFDRAIKKKQNR